MGGPFGMAPGPCPFLYGPMQCWDEVVDVAGDGANTFLEVFPPIKYPNEADPPPDILPPTCGWFPAEGWPEGRGGGPLDGGLKLAVGVD